MKKLLLILFYTLFLGITNIRANNEFYYDREQLHSEFNDIETKYSSTLVKLKTQLQLSDSLEEFTLYDLEIESFCTGLCCGPVGLVTINNKNHTVVEKKSLFVGCATSSVSLLIGFIAVLATDGLFFFF